MGALMLARGAVTQDSFLPRNTADLIDICSAGQSDLFYTAATNFCQGFVVRVFRALQEENMARSSGRLFWLPEFTPTRYQEIVCLPQRVRANPCAIEQLPGSLRCWHRVVDVAPAGSTDRSMDRGACP
jgi:hypothetical protein